jgi:hypothetical protein
MSKTVKQRIADAILEHFDGEIVDVEGKVTRELHKHLPEMSFATLSSVITEMDQAGLIVRDMPSQRKCTRIALPEHSSHPSRKSLESLIASATTEITAILLPQVQAAIDAGVEVGIANAAPVDSVAQDRLDIEAEVEIRTAAMVSALERLMKKQASHSDNMDQIRDELVEVELMLETETTDLKARLAIAENNVRVWREKAEGRTNVTEAMATIRTKLSHQDRNELDRMMRAVPESN